MCSLAVFSGLRRAELAALTTDDVTKHHDSSISVFVRNGKGSKQRSVTLPGAFGRVKRDRMPIRQISLYSKRARQILIEMSGRIALGEKVKTISWLSRFCEISNINSATSNPSRASTQHLQIAMGGQEAMLRGRKSSF